MTFIKIATLTTLSAGLLLGTATGSPKLDGRYEGKFRFDQRGSLSFRVHDERVSFKAKDVAVACDPGGPTRRNTPRIRGELRGRHFELEASIVNARDGIHEYYRVIGHVRRDGTARGYLRLFYISVGGSGIFAADLPDCTTFGRARWLAEPA